MKCLNDDCESMSAHVRLNTLYDPAARGAEGILAACRFKWSCDGCGDYGYLDELPWDQDRPVGHFDIALGRDEIMKLIKEGSVVFETRDDSPLQGIGGLIGHIRIRLADGVEVESMRIKEKIF